ncbi:MAG TPA: hypothetical protein VGE59_02355 [Patescibacteria group bacterium]
MITQYTDIRCPMYGRIDMRQVHHTLRRREVQRMLRVSQLGAVSYVFPGATHNRLMHMIGVYYITKLRADDLLNRKLITEQEHRDICLTGLVHDIGHEILSHMLELLRGNHDDAGVRLVLGELAEAIRLDGGNPEAIAAHMRRETKLSQLVFGAPCGADTLDYLARDAHQVSGEVLQFDALFCANVRWSREHGLYLLPRGMPQILSVMNRYWHQYCDIYERISVRLAQRYLQELLRQVIELDPSVCRYLHVSGEAGTMGAVRLWCEDHPETEAARRHELWLERRYPKKAFVYSPWPQSVPVRDKDSVRKIACDVALLEGSELWSPEALSRKEQEVAELLGLAPEEVSIAPSPPSRRWRALNMPVMSCGEVVSLTSLFPAIQSAGEMYGQMSRNVVASFTEEARARLIQSPEAARKVLQVLER